jgi:hypothetical protein
MGNQLSHDQCGQVYQARPARPGFDLMTKAFFRNKAGMSLKTKGHCGKLAKEPGMSMKTKALSQSRRESCS